TPDYTSIPSCLFTVPGLASVGLTQATAEEKGLELRVEVNDMREWLSGRTYAETAAWAKVLVDWQTDCIVGAHTEQSRPCEPKKRALSVEKTAVFGYCWMASGTVSGNCGKSATDRDGKGVAIIVMGAVRP